MRDVKLYPYFWFAADIASAVSNHVFTPAQAYVAKMLQTLVEFPQRQKSASFNLEQVMAKLQTGIPDS